MTDNSRNNPTRLSPRPWIFRLLAVLFGLSLFGVIELLLAVCDIGRPVVPDDPYISFDRVHPLFELNPTETRYEIPLSRQNFFAPQSFPKSKAKQTFRIFCLGGSTVQGRPYSTDTSFSTWLRLSLSAADPQINWEVINCGGISYASYRLAVIMRECLGYEPDLIILCTGHNEFLEERTYAHVKYEPPVLKFARSHTEQLRTYSLLKAAYQSFAPDPTSQTKPVLSAETKALLDYEDGIAAYHRDNELRDKIVSHYEYNIRRMLAMAGDAAVPLLLIRPPSNLKDSPPFKSQHRDGMSSEELQDWKALVRKARTHYRDDLSRSIKLFDQALAIDDQYAATHYERGRCLLLTGDVVRAHQSFLQAREHDICPLRMIAPLEEALATAAADTGTPLIDAHVLLVKEYGNSIPGDDILVDHVHPKIRGHQLIANELTEQMIALGMVRPGRSDWKARRTNVYEQHFSSLNDIYFARGLRELKALRAWAAGRVEEPLPE